eukprot:7741823-Ditylum_brightwellii.AAC.1
MEGLAMEYIDASNSLNEQKRLKGIEREQSAIMEDTDGCSKQDRSASSLYLISTVCMKYGTVIDHVVGAPGHSKGVVDGLNAVDK